MNGLVNESRNALTRRQMLGTAVRWTVPTVVTMTLGARVLEAKASCPPCQKKNGATCKACSMSQMLNCQCEPCLGPPYCAAVGPVAPQQPGGTPLGTQRAPGSTPGNPVLQNSQYPSYMDRQKAMQQRNPFNQDPFGTDRNRNDAPGLYQRLRPDTVRSRP